MVFDDIVGQYEAIRSIKNSIKNNRVAHAYLFCGPDGVGKSVAASILASALNCREKGVDPCGKCPSCIRARDGNHPDIVHFKTQNAIIHVNEIRELQRDMQKKPYENGVKVYIIHDADKMNAEAQNSLLKTLEEPPMYVIIILLSKNQYSLLKTIVSRCQIVRFTRVSEKDIETYLKSKRGIDYDEARFAAAFSDGILERAEQYLSNEDLKKSRNEIIDIAKGIYKGDKVHVLSYVDFFMNNKNNIDYILDVFLSYFRDIMVYNECRDDKYLINLDKKYIIADECEKFTYNSLINIINCIKRTAENIKSNANYQLSIETMLLGIQEG